MTHRGYLFNGATSRSDGVLAEVLGGTLCRGCPPLSVALIWHALLPGTAGEAVAQEGFAQLEVALPSSLTHVAMIGVFSERGEHGGQCCDRRGPAQAFGHHRGP